MQASTEQVPFLATACNVYPAFRSGVAPLDALVAFLAWVREQGATYGVAYAISGPGYNVTVYGALPSPHHFGIGGVAYRYGEQWTASVQALDVGALKT